MKKVIFSICVGLLIPFMMWGQAKRTASGCNLSVSIDTIVVAPCFRIGNGNNSISGGGACGCNNTLWAVVNGGAAPYTYTWVSAAGVVVGNADTLYRACYELWTVKVEDASGCSTSAEVNIVIPPRNKGGTDTTSSTAGIMKYSNTSSVKLYPVPASNQLNISLAAPANNTHVEIFDVLGKKLLEQSIADGLSLTTIDVSAFEAGSYFARIVGNNNQKTIRFTINR